MCARHIIDGIVTALLACVSIAAAFRDGSQRARKTWDEFNELLQRHSLPRASVHVQLW